MKSSMKFLASLVLAMLCASAACGAEMTVTDCLGRSVTVPVAPQRILGSGSGALRLLTYLQANDRVIAVDSIEKRNDPPQSKASRPYAFAHPEFAALPLFGEFRGKDNPELIAGLSLQPQVIFKVSPLSGPHPDQLTAKTGIPVIGLEYGNLSDEKEQFYATLRLMGKVLDKEQRAEEVVAFFEKHLAELRRRTAGVPEEKRRSCYIGGVSMRGTHGFTSTETGYPPFLYTGAKNVASDGSGRSETVNVAKEKILQWDPQVVFMDINTLRAKGEASGLWQLSFDPVYAELSAVENGEIWSVLPYNSYTINYGSVLVNSYFVGKTLYPDRFADVEIASVADEIYSFLVGKPLYAQISEALSGKIFCRLNLEGK
ncbi:MULTISPECIES: iron ABC transporter substrate-binding protein [unclassified Pyramidobacter]|uniref:iron ABC transporter substrate-binding protein n=1 Tax=unclassified Pyramidobacter TaxID=2632171 RepID=UPI000EA1BC7A|nr:iron ABC transporter substrate-binding protein [Pyramidobacter sp. CG50-2]RKJ79129.1 iron ABC transporter substrate-binding protein [Pyramidobacter sp. CG50-2]